MKDILRLAGIICIVATISSVTSHVLIAWLKIETSFGDHWSVDPKGAGQSAFVAGSSLAGDGISWSVVADEIGLGFEGWGVAGSSPSEWEQFQHLTKHTHKTIFVVSAYDLNEYFISSFFADIVPLWQTIKDIRESHVEWDFSKRLLSTYPLMTFQAVFPTAGRSFGVIGGLREHFVELFRPLFLIQSEAGPTLSFDQANSMPEYKKERISNWSSGLKLRRLVGMRIACQGRHEFNGPKRLAFIRSLRKASEQGHVMVVVLPVSPTYRKEFLTVEMNRELEGALDEARTSVPIARWIRLDQANELDTDYYFWDLVHMNLYGQEIATEAFLVRLRELKGLQ